MLEVDGSTPSSPRAAGATSDAFFATVATVSEHAADLVVLLDAKGHVVHANPAASLTFGVTAEDAVGTFAAAYLHPDDVPRAVERFAELVGCPGATSTDTVRFVSSDHEVRILEIVTTNLLDDPCAGCVLVNGMDVTQRRQLETELLEQSLHDALTGLPNRTLFVDRAERLLAVAHRDRIPIGVLFVDLDDFKTFNDGMGHFAGDQLLVAVARRMRNALRNEDLLCRFGGDEFVVLVDPRVDASSPEVIAQRITDVLRSPFELSGRVMSVTASVGVASGYDVSVDDLVRDADLAMYHAKARGKNQTASFSPQMMLQANERLQLVLDLQGAIERREFVVHFQPIVELEGRTVTGMEALVRWQHPTRGLLGPPDFLATAEENGLIVDIGRLVLAEACARAVDWGFTERRLTLSINLSARQLASDSLVEDLAGVLASTGLDPSRVLLEVTEATVMQDTAAAVSRLRELKALGVRLAIDDFGTGYSSLSYLPAIPVDALKIDRCFVAEVDGQDGPAAIVRLLIELGRTLELEIVAEGVEHEHQLRALRREHCDKAQGYLFARPLAPERFGALLDAQPGRARAGSGSTVAVVHEDAAN